MVVPITDIVKMTLSVADILVEPIIGTPLLQKPRSGPCGTVRVLTKVITWLVNVNILENTIILYRLISTDL